MDPLTPEVDLGVFHTGDTLADAPEASTWTFMLLGLAGGDRPRYQV